VIEPRRVQRAVWGSDGVFYAVGSTPPPEVAEEFGDHIWQAPETAPAGGLLMPMVSAPTERTEPSGVQVAPVNPFTAPEPAKEPEKPAEAVQAAPAAAPERSRASVEVPPVRGPGSSVEAWREYAATKGVEVPEHAKRAEIVEALETAGHPVN